MTTDGEITMKQKLKNCDKNYFKYLILIVIIFLLESLS